MLEFPGAILRPAIYQVAAVSDEFRWMAVVRPNPLFGRGFRKGLMNVKQSGQGPGPEDDGIARHVLSPDLEVKVGCLVDVLVALSEASNPLAPRYQLSRLDMHVFKMSIQGEDYLPLG